MKQLEKCEEELKDKSKEYDKTESKLELMKGTTEFNCFPLLLLVIMEPNLKPTIGGHGDHGGTLYLNFFFWYGV